MNDSRVSPDDPRLTAYALGELQGDDRAAIEAVLVHDAGARAIVAQTRALAEEMKSALASEPDITPEFTAGESEAPRGSGALAAMPPYAPGRGPRLLRFPQLYFVIGTLAAACFAVMIGLHESKPSVSYTIVNVNPPAAPAERRDNVGNPSGTAAPASPAIARITSGTSSSPADLPPAARNDEAVGGGLLADVKAERLAAQSQGTDGSGATVASSPTGGIAAAPPAPANSGAAIAAAAPASAGGAAAPTDGGHGRVQTLAGTRIVADGLVLPPQAPPGLEDRAVIRLSPFTVPNGAPASYQARNAFSGSSASARVRETASDTLPDLDASTGDGEGAEAAAAPPPAAPRAWPYGGAFIGGTQSPVVRLSIPSGSGSYAALQHAIEGGHLPPRDAVRIEELLNRFAGSGAPAPATSAGSAKLAASLEVASAPWAPSHRLVRVVLRGQDATPRAAAAGARSEAAIVANDVAIAVEFNPRRVAMYRMIGYEKPAGAAARPAVTTPASGAIAAGRVVSALFEVVPVSADSDNEPADQGYGPVHHLVSEERPRALPQLLTLDVEYRRADTGVRDRLIVPLVDAGATFGAASADFKFAAGVAAFGLVLHDSPYRGHATVDNAIAWAAGGTSEGDVADARTAFLDLMRRSRGLVR